MKKFFTGDIATVTDSLKSLRIESCGEYLDFYHSGIVYMRMSLQRNSCHPSPIESLAMLFINPYTLLGPDS